MQCPEPAQEVDHGPEQQRKLVTSRVRSFEQDFITRPGDGHVRTRGKERTSTDCRDDHAFDEASAGNPSRQPWRPTKTAGAAYAIGSVGSRP
jgi:hypothetical protein